MQQQHSTSITTTTTTTTKQDQHNKMQQSLQLNIYIYIYLYNYIYACINITLHAIAIYIVCSDNVCSVRTRLSLIWYREVTVSHHISGRGLRGLWSSCSSYKKRKVCAQGEVLQSSHIKCFHSPFLSACSYAVHWNDSS